MRQVKMARPLAEEASPARAEETQERNGDVNASRGPKTVWA